VCPTNTGNHVQVTDCAAKRAGKTAEMAEQEGIGKKFGKKKPVACKKKTGAQRESGPVIVAQLCHPKPRSKESHHALNSLSEEGGKRGFVTRQRKVDSLAGWSRSIIGPITSKAPRRSTTNEKNGDGRKSLQKGIFRRVMIAGAGRGREIFSRGGSDQKGRAAVVEGWDYLPLRREGTNKEERTPMTKPGKKIPPGIQPTFFFGIDLAFRQVKGSD